MLFLLSLPIWIFEAALFFTIGYSFELQHLYTGFFGMAIAMVLITALSNLGSSIPAAPGGIGLFELITREALVLLPLADNSTRCIVDPDDWLGATISFIR